MKVLKWCLLLALMAYGCAFTSVRPKSWEAPEVSYDGIFSNVGEVDPQSAERGHTARPLAVFFWPDNPPADKVRLVVSADQVSAQAFKGSSLTRQGEFPLTNGQLIIKKKGTYKEGGSYQDQYVFTRNQQGLIIESTGSGWTPAFIFPIIGSEQSWYFFPAAMN